MSILYKYDIITVEELCYVWNTSINKHPMIVTQLYQFWIEMAYVLQYEDINKYAQTATVKEVDINSGNNENGEYFLFFFDLVIAIINNNVKSDDKKNEVTVHENIDKMLEQMISIAYQMLLTSFDQPYFSTLVTKYGTVVMESRYCEQLIKETYYRLV